MATSAQLQGDRLVWSSPEAEELFVSQWRAGLLLSDILPFLDYSDLLLIRQIGVIGNVIVKRELERRYWVEFVTNRAES